MSRGVQLALVGVLCFALGWLVAQPFPAAPAQADVKKPRWQHGLELKVRKGSETTWKDARPYGIEVFRDENTGNLVYISETGSIAVVPGMGTQATVYASWNGATTVVRWQILAGDAPESLNVLSEVPRVGFETTAEIETAAAWVAVQAIDADGNIIGASETIPLR